MLVLQLKAGEPKLSLLDWWVRMEALDVGPSPTLTGEGKKWSVEQQRCAKWD